MLSKEEIERLLSQPETIVRQATADDRQLILQSFEGLNPIQKEITKPQLAHADIVVCEETDTYISFTIAPTATDTSSILQDSYFILIRK
ncbi:hypothetical protein [Lysinibacillus sp. 54212]|uniref:hypothetical protein n=1 Tax=Lysinibacillus sp. 54212 TaxID=3119829 RepID=UPI002FC6316C